MVANFTGAGIRGPGAIASGADGNLWFTNVGSGSIGRITPDGAVASFTAMASGLLSSVGPGPDGNMWFTTRGNAVGYVGTGVAG